MALIWIIDYSVISAIWTRIWHPSFRYEIPEKDRLIFFIKMAQKIITDLLNLSTNNVFMCIHSMTFLSSLNIWTGINMHALQKPELTLKEWQHPFVFVSVIKEIFLKWLVLSKVISCTGQRVILANFYVFIQYFCFTPLLLCMTHNDLPTKWIFIKESARWSGIHYYDPYDRCGLTWIILCPLSALSLDEGLNALNGKNASAAGWFSRPIKCQL
jgi:hypothetical protein